MGVRALCLPALALALAVGAASAQEPIGPPVTLERRAAGDEAIEAGVARALEEDRGVHAMQIKVAVAQGIVTLTGTAADLAAKDAAEAAVRRVEGVRDVQNRLVVAEKGQPAPGASVIPEVPGH
jgi:osmotically-inducible protein OsmY